MLFLAYYFPPIGGAASLCNLKSIKYLPAFDWNPIVLSTTPQRNHLIDTSLLAEVPAGVQVYRTYALHLPSILPWRMRNFIVRWILLIDEQIGWLPFALSTAKRILSTENIHAIYTASAPVTAHLAGEKLKAISGLPWIADFRDPWIGNFNYVFPTRLHHRFAQALEMRILNRADLTIVASEPMRAAFLERYPHLHPAKVLTLTNGYDSLDFEGSHPVDRDPSRFQITFTGTFYTHKLTPFSFLSSIKRLIDRQIIHPNKIRINLIGNIGKPARKIIAELGLSSIVHAPGYVDHRTSIGYLLAADVLLLIIPSGPGSEAILTTKLFEYLAAQKPILAIAPAGDAARLIERARAGVIVPPEDEHELDRQLTCFYQSWERGLPGLAPNLAVCQEYDRRALTKILVEKLNELLN